MQDANVALKIFSANLIEKEKLAFPVRIELLDLGLSPIFETIATGKDEDGNYLFSGDRFIARSSARPTAFRVRFTAGDESFARTIPA